MAQHAYMGIPSLALHGEAVTPSDTTVLAATKGLYVGVQGDVKVLLQESDDPVTFVGISGFLPVMAVKVYSTDTTATDIVALY